MFFTQPKIKRIGLHLESTLTEICRASWSYYLTKVSSAEAIEYADHLEEEIDLEKVFATPELYRGKEHFPWVIFPQDGANRVYERTNASMQYQFHCQLLKDAKTINKELNSKPTNYQSIIELAKRIKDNSVKIPSIDSGETITFSVDSTFGGNLFTDFFIGAASSIHAIAMLIVGLGCMAPYWLSYSEYCGGPEFFLDTVVYLCESLRKLAFAVIFPLGMLYSAYTTDSYNPFTKGEVQRSLDGIIAIAEELKTGEIDQVEEGQSSRNLRHTI
ncbi:MULTISPECIES: hypothetical protein [Legionella]|uniref:Uncharacterized protein n=1 Tax=Legionella drozanskii LLAP-1 TaxID=1212489 RepID=A0A0W0TDX9_9GAMM|nr:MULTISPECIES: hypothetical protein [Legionella]KTC93762.1 hypothetical protein Ldro_0112 [Legionella drozanskii LLAP-1]PJE13580.1 MAG: hypothetical protein CK430_06150 [Legionella sp.]